MSDYIENSDKIIMFAGRRITCFKLISELDSSRYGKEIRKLPDSEFNRYCYMICPIQELLMDYVNGTETIHPELKDWFERNKFPMPEHTEMIPGIEEMFQYLCKSFHIDADAMLDRVAEQSKDKIRMIEASLRALEHMKEVTASIIKEIGPAPAGILDKISWILAVQQEKGKREYCNYEEVEKHELQVMSTLIIVLLFAGHGQNISYAVLCGLTDYGLLKDGEIEKLLEQNGGKADLEYYKEAFLGESPDEETCIPARELLRQYHQAFEKALKLPENSLCS